MKPNFSVVMAGVAAILFAGLLSAQPAQADTGPLNGPWECVDSTGVHGIFFEGGPDDLDIFVYERRKGEKWHGGYFTSSPRYQDGVNRVTLTIYRLVIHFEKSPTNRPPFDLDLVFDVSGHRWKGFWSDCQLEGGAVLERPHRLLASSEDRLVGDWTEERTLAPHLAGSQAQRPMQGHIAGKPTALLHIRQSIDGQLMTWLVDSAGRTMKLYLKSDGNTLSLTPNNFFGRSRHYEGHLSADRSTITGQWNSEGLGGNSTVYRLQKFPPKPAGWPLGVGFGAIFVIVVAVVYFRNRLLVLL